MATIIQAEEKEEALRLLRDHPYFSPGTEYTSEQQISQRSDQVMGLVGEVEQVVDQGRIVLQALVEGASGSALPVGMLG